MNILCIQGFTNVFGAPPDWKPIDGDLCGALPVRQVETDQGTFYVSAWEPTVDELAKILAGESVRLWVRASGPHPVVALSVGEP